MRLRRSRYTLPLAAGTIAGGAAAGAMFATAEHIVRQITAPAASRRPVHMGFTPFETGVDFVDVTFPGGDGMPLGGWLLTRPERAPAILACGGYRARRSDLLGIASGLWRAGFTVFLFDYKGYGDEPGAVTLGYRELADARAALDFLRRQRPQSPVGAIGFSMGAAIAIMLAAREPELRAVFADSPFTSQREIVRYHLGRALRLHQARHSDLIAGLLLALVDRRLAQLFGFRFADVDPLRDVSRLAPRPLYLIHGEEDSIIPVEHTRRMASAARQAGVPVTARFTPGAGHCDTYFLDRSAYCATTATFFTTHLGPPQPAPAVRPAPGAVSAGEAAAARDSEAPGAAAAVGTGRVTEHPDSALR